MRERAELGHEAGHIGDGADHASGDPFADNGEIAGELVDEIQAGVFLGKVQCLFQQLDGGFADQGHDAVLEIRVAAQIDDDHAEFFMCFDMLQECLAVGHSHIEGRRIVQLEDGADIFRQFIFHFMQEIIDAFVMGVKGGAVDVSAETDIFDSDLGNIFLTQQREKTILDQSAGHPDASVIAVVSGGHGEDSFHLDKVNFAT